MIRRAGVLYHPARADSTELATRVRALLEGQGINVWCGQADDESALRKVAPELDLLVTLGGDGTIVRAVRCVATSGVPVLGVNLGRLGFLAEVEPADVDARLGKLTEGAYFVESRRMLSLTVRRDGRVVHRATAVNDLVVARGPVARTVRVAVEVDDRHFMTPTCDGIIVSTPTGSTAYCLAAGGPIVAPDVDCLVVTPIAAHLGIAHSLVIPSHRALRLTLMTGIEAMATVDGHVDIPLHVGDRLLISACDHVAKFVRFASNGYFYATVLSKLGWPDRGPAPAPESAEDEALS